MLLLFFVKADGQPSKRCWYFVFIYSSNVQATAATSSSDGSYKVHHKRISSSSSSPQQQQRRKSRFHKNLHNNSINRASLNEIKMTLIEVSLNMKPFFFIFTQSTLSLCCVWFRIQMQIYKQQLQIEPELFLFYKFIFSLHFILLLFSFSRLSLSLLRKGRNYCLFLTFCTSLCVVRKIMQVNGGWMNSSKDLPFFQKKKKKNYSPSSFNGFATQFSFSFFFFFSSITPSSLCVHF